MSRLLHGVIIVSIIIGSFFGVCTFFAFIILEPGIALPMALFLGAFASLLMSVFGCISLITEKKRFASVEKLLKIHNIFCQSDGARIVENKLLAGRIYFCQDGKILFIYFKSKKHIVETILPGNIQKAEILNKNFRFHIDNGIMYTAMINGIAKESLDILKDKYNVV